MATITFVRLAPVSAIKATASRMEGIAIRPSMTRMTTVSTRRTKPLRSPTRRPAAIEKTATPIPASSDTRPP